MFNINELESGCNTPTPIKGDNHVMKLFNGLLPEAKDFGVSGLERLYEDFIEFKHWFRDSMTYEIKAKIKDIILKNDLRQKKSV